MWRYSYSNGRGCLERHGEYLSRLLAADMLKMDRVNRWYKKTEKKQNKERGWLSSPLVVDVVEIYPSASVDFMSLAHLPQPTCVSVG